MRLCITIKFLMVLWLASGLNSLQAQVLPDFDSVQTAIHLDSLKPAHTAELTSEVDSLRQSFNAGLEKLNQLEVSSPGYTVKVDSLYKTYDQRVKNLQEKYTSNGIEENKDLARLDSVMTSRTQYLDSVMSSHGINQLGQGSLPPSLTEKIPALPELNGSGMKLPSTSVGVPEVSLPMSDVIPEIEMPGVNVPDVPQGNISDMGMDGLPNPLSAYTQEIGALSSTTEKIKSVDGEQVDQALQNQVMKTDALGEVSTQTKAAEGLEKKMEGMNEAVQSPDKLKEEAKEKMIDHFEGKEEMIKKEMDDIGKTQLKYRNVADSRFLPKRPPNEMKGRPWVERLIPGVSIQVFQQNNISVDFAPFLGYRFSGKISAGLSGYQRLTYFRKDDKIRAVRIYGIRLYTTVKVIGNFSAHGEGEYFQDHYSSHHKTPHANGQDDKISPWKLNVGVQQRYPVGKRMFGHFLIMYDLVQIREFPNTSGSSVRFGFDYQLRKKKKEKKT